MKIFFGNSPTLSNADARHFSRGGYICRALMETHKGSPVVISQSKSQDFPVWKVEHDFSCLVFATKEEAMRYCKAHYRALPE